jgi:hypothetical protein
VSIPAQNDGEGSANRESSGAASRVGDEALGLEFQPLFRTDPIRDCAALCENTTSLAGFRDAEKYSIVSKFV